MGRKASFIKAPHHHSKALGQIQQTLKSPLLTVSLQTGRGSSQPLLWSEHPAHSTVGSCTSAGHTLSCKAALFTTKLSHCDWKQSVKKKTSWELNKKIIMLKISSGPKPSEYLHWSELAKEPIMVSEPITNWRWCQTTCHRRPLELRLCQVLR